MTRLRSSACPSWSCAARCYPRSTDRLEGGGSRIRVRGLLGWDDERSLTRMHNTAQETLSVSRVSQTLDRIHVTFDDDNLVANAGLLLPATLVERLGVEALINTTVRLDGRVGGASPGRKVLTLVNTMLAGGSHIDHADMLRAGASEVGGVASGDGTVDARDVPAVVHVRSCPPTRSRQRHRASARHGRRRRLRVRW